MDPTSTLSSRIEVSHEHLAREALRIRISMLYINELLEAGMFRVPIHLAFGHEGIAVAVSTAMGEHDCLALTHRNVHYNLARCSSLGSKVAEYRLLPSAPTKGRYGAMNLINPEVGVAYTSSILGNCLPVAVGICKERIRNHPGAVAFAVTGDGAMEEGAFYEALLLAKSLRLPVVFVVENNQWSMYSRIEDRRCPIDLAKLAESLGVPFESLSGSDLHSTVDRVQRLRDRSQGSSSPSLVEVQLETLGDRTISDTTGTIRHINYHHGPVAGLTRRSNPVLERSDRDPIHRLSTSWTPAAWADLVSEVQQDVLAELE